MSAPAMFCKFPLSEVQTQRLPVNGKTTVDVTIRDVTMVRLAFGQALGITRR